jgi:ADP-heptose:LPS heptosyltransferase
MHLAAAIGRPLLSIHTWSDPRKVGPFSENAWIWQGGEIRRQNFETPPLEEVPFTVDAAAVAGRFAAERMAEG